MINGTFKSKRGTWWNYTVSEDGHAEMWHENFVRCIGGWKRGKDTILDASKELREYIKEKHGIECVDYDRYSGTKVQKTNLFATDIGYYANGKLYRQYEGRIVWEEIGTGLLMVKNNGWCGVGWIKRENGKVTVYEHGGIRINDPKHECEIITYQQSLASM